MSENEIPKYIQEKIEKEKNFGQLVADIKTDLKTSDRYKHFFEKYHPRSIDSFIDSYANKKASYLTYGQWYIEQNNQEMLKYRLIAEERIWDIQQKKLFDMQCRWRAEKIKIPYIQASYDFEYWEKAIENCPFVSPISEDEIQLYKEFVLSEEYDEWEWNTSSWQNYNLMKRTDEDDEYDDEIPVWYEYYDTRKGTGSLFKLPDIRGEKEEYYLDIYRKEDRRRQAESGRVIPQSEPPDKRPFISAWDPDVIETFIKAFENNKLLEYFKAYEKSIELSNDDDLELAIDTLKQAEEEIQLEHHNNWRMAILLTARRFEQRKIAEALESVYRDYVNRMKLGISFEVHESERSIKWAKDFAGTMKSHILMGRVLNGEPADFNF